MDSSIRALVTGATGFVGQRLVAELDSPAVLSRSAEGAARRFGDAARPFAWSGAGGPPPAEALEGVNTVFHLAGEPVAGGRWTPEKKKRILDSRVLGTRNLVEAIAQADSKPDVLVSASAIGFYGSGEDEVLSESSPAGDDFLAEVCVGWEEEAAKAEALGVRVVMLRIGIVLGPDGGPLAEMLPPFKMGVGGRMGSGKQWMAWIHLDDVVGLLLFAATNPSLSGPVNATAPNPVRNAEFTQTLGEALRRPTLLGVPEFALSALFGEFAQVVLASQRVVPERAIAAGYEFAYPDLGPALKDLV